MKTKKLNSEIYNELCNRLPEFCNNYAYIGLSEKSASTRIAYVRDVLYFLEFAISMFPYFPDKKTTELTIEDFKKIQPNDVNLYLSYMKDQDISEKTRARRKSSVSTLFTYLINTERKLDFNPVSGSVKIKLPQKDFVIYLTQEEQDRLLEGIRLGSGLTERELKLHARYVKRDIAIIFLFLDMGIRISELHGMDIKDVDLSDCSVIIQRKGGKLARLWFSDESKEYLEDYIKERTNRGDYMHGDDALFVTLDQKRLSIRAIQAMLEKYLKACLPEKADMISVHKLRSSFAMTYYKATQGDILSLQQRLGHTSISTTNVYAKAAELEMKQNRNWRK